MDNKFMPPPPTGARNNMPPPPPPPRREPPKETQVEENASAVPNMESATSTSTVSPNQPTFVPPPREFPPKFNDRTTPEAQNVSQSDVLSERGERTDVAEMEGEKSKEKTKSNLKTVLYWGGFAVSIALIILFGYLLFI